MAGDVKGAGGAGINVEAIKLPIKGDIKNESIESQGFMTVIHEKLVPVKDDTGTSTVKKDSYDDASLPNRAARLVTAVANTTANIGRRGGAALQVKLQQFKSQILAMFSKYSNAEPKRAAAFKHTLDRMANILTHTVD